MRVLMSIGGPSVFETDAPADEILWGPSTAWPGSDGPAVDLARDGTRPRGKHISTSSKTRDRAPVRRDFHGDGIHAATTAVGRGREGSRC